MPKPTHTIDVDTTTRTGVRGRLDRLLHEYTMKAQALKITTQILDEDDRAQALDAAPKKFLQAMNTRNSHAGRVPVEEVVKRSAPKVSRAERIEMIAAFLKQHDGATTREVAAGVGVLPNRVLALARAVAKPVGGGRSRAPMTWFLKSKRTNGVKRAAPVRRHKANTPAPIHGKALSLFLLEHLDEEVSRPLTAMVEALAEAGSPLRSPQALNGPLHAALIRKGYVRLTDDGFQRTSKGVEFAQSLRPLLEAQGKIAPGSYTVAA